MNIINIFDTISVEQKISDVFCLGSDYGWLKCQSAKCGTKTTAVVEMRDWCGVSWQEALPPQIDRATRHVSVEIFSSAAQLYRNKLYNKSTINRISRRPRQLAGGDNSALSRPPASQLGSQTQPCRALLPCTIISIVHGTGSTGLAA